MSDSADTTAPDPKGKKIIGIDLGTCFSCVAHIDEYGRVETIYNDDSPPSATTASAVLVEGEDDITVGQLAREQAVAQAENVITLAKRQMGKDTKLMGAGLVYTPEEVSAMILKKLKQDADRKLDTDVADAVITVPAYFGLAERKATQDAGEMAGFVVHQVLSEPVAAALAYGYRNPNERQTLLVYDLGGGTFDVTLFVIGPPETGTIPKIKMISTGGSHRLGGADWDRAIVDHVADEFMKQCFPDGEEPPEGMPKDPRAHGSSHQDLLTRSEKAKIALQKSKKPAKIVCQHAGKTAVIKLDIDQLKALTQHLLDSTEAETDMLLKDHGYAPDRPSELFPDADQRKRVDRVILAGGSTRLKMVRELLDDKFPGKVDDSLDVDQCVAQGAAWMGHLLSQSNGTDAGGGETEPGPLPSLVAPHAFGVAARNEANELGVYPLVVKDQSLPCQEADKFETQKQGQTSIRVRIFENEVLKKTEVRDPELCREVGEVVIDGLPPGRPAGQVVEVSFEVDNTFRMSVVATDVASGKQSKGKLNIGSGLDDAKKAATRGKLAEIDIQS